jgi:hypothetical protein
MRIQAASWADFGYRKVGPLPATSGGLAASEVAQRVLQSRGYEHLSGEWVRRRGRKKGSYVWEALRLLSVIDKNTTLDDDTLSFVDKHAASEWVELERQEGGFRADPDTLLEAVRDAEENPDRWRGMYRLAQSLFYAGAEGLRPMIRQYAAPCFFRLYPEGKIVVLSYDTGLDTHAALQRVMYAAAQAPLLALKAGGFGGVRTMSRWHFASLTHLTPMFLDLFGFLFYPFVGGSHAAFPGLVLLFLFEPAERHSLVPFPRNWLGWASKAASFGGEYADTASILKDFHGPAHQRASHQRYLHESGFPVSDRLELLRWYIGRVNRLLYELTDVANFTEDCDPQSPIDPVLGFEHLLTVDRLWRKTLLAMSLDEGAAGNLMAFEIADLYDTISRRLKNTASDTEFFKLLFHPRNGPARIAPILSNLPAPFGDYFNRVLGEVYEKIEQTVLDSVWLKSKVTPGGINVRDRTLANESALPAPDFVAEMMRAYRNAHHGYFTASDPNQSRPSRFLFLTDGNLPVEMSALPVLWWLAYLADPAAFVGWKHLAVDAYD